MNRTSCSSETTLDTARGRFRVALDGDSSAPPLILSNSLGTTLEMWDPQVDVFARTHRLIRYDTRGHGGSLVTPGPYTFDMLGQDVLALLDALDIEKAAFCGVSMGGHIGLWLGINAGARLDALAVCNSAARIGTTQAWSERAATVRLGGASAMQALSASAPGRWFTDAFVAASPLVVRLAQEGIAGVSPEGYAACCEALATSDLRADIARICTPTLLLAGEFDPVTTISDAAFMHCAIPKSRLGTVPASHLSNLEAPGAFEHAVLQFLASPASH